MNRFKKLTKKKILLTLLFGVLFLWLLAQFPLPWHPDLATWVKSKIDDGQPIELNADGSVSLNSRFREALDHSLDDNWAVDVAQQVGLSNGAGFVRDWYRETLGVDVRVQSPDGFPLLGKFGQNPLTDLTGPKLRELRSCLKSVETELDAMVAATRKTRFSSLPFMSDPAVGGGLVGSLLHLSSATNDLCRALKFRARCRMADRDFVGASNDLQALLRVGKDLRNNPMLVWADRGAFVLADTRERFDIGRFLRSWLTKQAESDRGDRLKLAIEWFRLLETCSHNPMLSKTCGETNKLIALDLLQWSRYGDDELIGLQSGVSASLLGGTKFVDWSIFADIYYDSQIKFEAAWNIEDPEDRLAALSALSQSLVANAERQSAPAASWKIVLSSGYRSVRAGEIASARLPTFTGEGGPFDRVIAVEKRDLDNANSFRAISLTALEIVFEIENGRASNDIVELKPTYEMYSESGVSWADFQKSVSVD